MYPLSSGSGYRVGVSPDVLRARERRYGLLKPGRTEGGYRLYTERDEWRVRLMQHHLSSGLSAAAAAHEVARMERASHPDESVETPFELTQQLAASLDAFDEDAAHELLDRALRAPRPGASDPRRTDALPPRARRTGLGAKHVSIAQEHFASRLIEGRRREPWLDEAR